MGKKNITPEEKQKIYEIEMEKIRVKHDKRLEYLAAKRARLTEKINKKFGDDPDRHELEMGVMTIDNDVWIDIADAQLVERAKTLELRYLK